MATDGVDGASHAAGGMVDHDTVRRAREAGLPPASAFLADNDTATSWGRSATSSSPGPTGTNVVDLTVLLAGDARPGRRRD